MNVFNKNGHSEALKRQKGEDLDMEIEEDRSVSATPKFPPSPPLVPSLVA